MHKKNDKKKISNFEIEMKMNDAKLAKTVDFVKIKIEKNAFFECLHTISDVEIAKNKNFDVKNEKIID